MKQAQQIPKQVLYKYWPEKYQLHGEHLKVFKIEQLITR